jgi:hypothetical protein
MAKEQQQYAEIDLAIDRDNLGNITGMRYMINDAGQDRKNIIEFIEMLSLLCHNTEETKRIAEELNKEKNNG